MVSTRDCKIPVTTARASLEMEDRDFKYAMAARARCRFESGIRRHGMYCVSKMNPVYFWTWAGGLVLQG